MKNVVYIVIGILGLSLSSCKDKAEKKAPKDDILVGELTVGVDESVLPLMQEQKAVFESSYTNAKLQLKAAPEVNTVNDLLSGKTAVAILTRNLTDEENKGFAQRSIQPRIYPIAQDAIVAFANINTPDTSIRVNEILTLMEGNKVHNLTLVFDNLNASVFRYFADKAKLKKVANTYVEGAKNGEDALRIVASSTNKIGLMGYNQYLSLARTFPEMDKIRILSVLNDSLATPRYVKPSQASIATADYPLTRTLYVMNYQPNLGLGIGFSSFLTGDRGQRIVLKSGLLPATMPGREIIIREGFN